ncbi:hypothetical protein F1640_09565 [Novosphingobium sp. NBM11]|uniref:hypothetical protein n=1 Tax=Novosphingobium sp. NBM11 TaxID=2596914 RepID=UPI00189225E2|nr:hypothetical protein [Novosphingobium sp. NBM11]MBF5090254.1 hypothetical protein [Novosphingobium sp. NBM11]
MIMWAVTIFMFNRLYVIVRYGAITVKGVTYSRRDAPIMYWIQMALIICGLFMIGGIAILVSLADLGVRS